MKALAFVREYGGRSATTLGYGRVQLHFAGKEPEPGSLICVEIPDLDKTTNAAVVDWVRRSKKKTKRSELCELPQSVWRQAVLDDFIDAEHYRYCVWHISHRFTAEQLDAFVGKWVPEAREQVRVALDHEDEELRAIALGEVMPLIQRVYAVTQNVPTQLNRHMQNTLERVERARIAAMQKGEPTAEDWIKAAGAMETTSVIQEVLVGIAKTLRTGREDWKRTEKLLARIRRKAKLRDAVAYLPEFWQPLEALVELPPTESDEVIDISDAREEMVPLSWWLLAGKRVGHIAPNRTALVITDGSNRTYIRGERKLKFRIARAGGQLEVHGNTLVVKEQADSINAALLEVDRLDTLANVDPKQALAALRELEVPKDHPVFEAARAAETDPRHGRVLADLLIELVVGIDADIARGLARASARANRR